MMPELPQWLHPLRIIIERYREHIPAAALFVGFVWDLLTLGRPDQIYGNVILTGYIVIAGGCILLLNFRRARGREDAQLGLQTLLQFCFGNLASGLFVFYGQSGTLTGNWLFLLILLGLLVGNEFLRGRYQRTYFHIAVYYALIFAYLALIVPVVFHQIGTRMFLVSAILSLGVISVYLLILWVFAPKLVRENLRRLAWMLGTIFWVFIGLYFGNFIPPVPLALTEIGIYHRIDRDVSGNYALSYEPKPWYALWRRFDSTFHKGPGESAYCFSSVYAPVGLTTPIYHRLEYYNEKSSGWETRTHIFFPIVGGRTEGYRGFSEESALEPGRWRCSVETSGGSLIGRRSFIVVAASSTPELYVEYK